MSLAGTRFVNTAAVDATDPRRRSAHRRTAWSGGSRLCLTALPLQVSSGLPFDIVSHPLAGGAVRVGYTQVSSGYFDVFKIPIVRGRAFTDRDDGASAGVVMINQAMARKFWPNADPVGDRIIIAKGYAPGFDEPARQIVGIAGDIHDEGLNRCARPNDVYPLGAGSPWHHSLWSRA